ncbi:MAG: fused MFS/spermidine synthase [Pseudomonadota bacterium]
MRLFSKRLAKSVSPGMTVEVIESRGIRQLQLGTQAIQSAMRVSRPWDLELAYTRAMMAFLLFRAGPAEVLMIGLGGGSLAKFIRKHRPQTCITAVEISPQVVSAARSHFFLPEDDETLRVLVEDGAQYVPAHPASADVILLDGFDAGNQVEALATIEFYQACRRALKPGGVLAVNLWGRDPEFVTWFSRLVAAFDGQVAWLPVMGKSNVVAFALADEDGPARLERAEIDKLAKKWGLDFAVFRRELHWAGEVAPLLDKKR